MFEFFEMPHFPIFRMRKEKWGISENSNIKNRGISKKQHVTSLKMENEPKMKMFDFEAFQNKMHMVSRKKYIFHIVFGVFHGTPRIAFIDVHGFPFIFPIFPWIFIYKSKTFPREIKKMIRNNPMSALNSSKTYGF